MAFSSEMPATLSVDGHAVVVPDEKSVLNDLTRPIRKHEESSGLIASGGGMMAPVKRAAERLVRRHWDAIERVAAALSERGELSGDEVDALIARPSRPLRRR